MSPEERRAAGTRICRALTEWIGRKVTPGLGGWDPAWSMVEKPSDHFMDCLRQWEMTGATDDFTELDRAYKALASAWLVAERQYQKVVVREPVHA